MRIIVIIIIINVSACAHFFDSTLPILWPIRSFGFLGLVLLEAQLSNFSFSSIVMLKFYGVN
jgi:hypothetical protein